MANEERWIEIAPGIRRRMITHGRTMYQQIAELDAGSHMPEHHHPQEQIMYIIRGRLRAIIDGQPREMSAGDCCYLAANQPHAVDTIEDSLVLDTFSPPRDDYLARDAQT